MKKLYFLFFINRKTQMEQRQFYISRNSLAIGQYLPEIVHVHSATRLKVNFR